jgi:predicted nucleic acid-binding protein
MCVTIDANVLIYASHAADPRHERARNLLTRLVAGPQIVYFFWPTIMAYVRIATHPTIFPDPLTFSEPASGAR